MRPPYISLVTIVLGTGAITAGCDAHPLPTTSAPHVATTSSAADARVREARNVDQQFARLAEQIPGFGGFYFDETGNPVIVLTRGADRSRAVTVLSQTFASRRFNLPGGRRSADWSAARVQLGEHDFIALQYWRKYMIDAVFAISGVTMLDVDERKNRVRVGVEDTPAEQRVLEALTRLRVPLNAVTVERVARFRSHQTLSDPATTMRAGLQIARADGYACTHGFVVWVQDPAGNYRHGFFTNSHCTQVQGGAGDQTAFYQPVGGQKIGTEVADAPYWTGGSTYGSGTVCPKGHVCRDSDAALVVYEPNISFDFSGIAQTPLGSDVISGNPYAVLGAHRDGFGHYEGDFLTKTGWSTGRTEGEATGTCLDLLTTSVSASGTPITLLCQYAYSAASAGGDSGSPVYALGVFFYPGPGNALAAGIHWGGNGTEAAYSTLYSAVIETSYSSGYAISIAP